MKSQRRPNAQIFLFFILFILSDPFSFADESGASHIDFELTEDEKDWLKKHSKIRIAGPLNFPPFHMYDENGVTRGIASDYVYLMLESLGVDIEVVNDLSWPEILEAAGNKELDLISCSARSLDRETYLLFSNPHLSFPLVIISRDDDGFLSGLTDLEDKTVAMVEKNIVADWLQEENLQMITYHYVKSPREALEAVSHGKADAYIGNLASCAYYINELGLVNLKVAAPTKFGNYNLYMAVRNDWPELVSILNKGLDAIAPEQHRDIRNNWLSLRYEHGIRPSDIIRIVVMVVFVAAVILGVVTLWNRRLVREIGIRKEKEQELQKALDDINTLTGLLPICSHCKNIRDDKGYWKRIDAYFESHSDISFSHGLCPDCIEKLYGKDYLKKKEGEEKS